MLLFIAIVDAILSLMYYVIYRIYLWFFFCLLCTFDTGKLYAVQSLLFLFEYLFSIA